MPDLLTAEVLDAVWGAVWALRAGPVVRLADAAEALTGWVPPACGLDPAVLWCF